MAAALGAADRVAGPRATRWVASVVLRARARSAAGWLDGVHRVATRPAPGAPALTRLPARWWTASPLARARRLGLRLDLDLRDNLQRALYATGTYEPAVLRLLHDEPRPGDVVVDVGAHIGVHALTAAARLRRLARPRGPPAPGWRSRSSRPATRRTGCGPRPPGPAGPGDQLRRLGRRARDRPPGPGQAGRRGAELAALQGMAGSLARLRPRALVVERKERVLERAGVDGDEVRRLLGRLGYQPTGQVPPVANEVYRPAATGRPPPSTR